MEKRLLAFFLATAVTIILYGQLMQWINPVQNQPNNQAVDIAIEDGQKDEIALSDESSDKNKDAPAIAPPLEIKNETVDSPERRFFIGSLDPKSPFRMLVILNNRGGSIPGSASFFSCDFHRDHQQQYFALMLMHPACHLCSGRVY